MVGTIASNGSYARALTHFEEWLPKELNMNEPETGKWYVIADKETRWGSFWSEKLGYLDCEIKPGAVICFWLKLSTPCNDLSLPNQPSWT